MERKQLGDKVRRRAARGGEGVCVGGDSCTL